MYRTFRFVPVVLLGAGLLWVAGCGSRSDDKKDSADKTAVTDSAKKPDDKPPTSGKAGKGSKDDDHGHKPGEHGGIIVSLGRDSYHVEAVFEKGGTVRLHMLGKEETRVQEVENQILKAFTRAEGASESIEFELKPSPQEGDAKGMTSQFIGKLPAELVGKKVEITIPNIRIGTERFRIGFTNVASASHSDDPGPALEGDAARKLHLTPGGVYTSEDILKNGKQTPAEKYKGFRAKHDFKPKVGDTICPITETKANPECTWVVGGKTYQFCCPPCIDEFVALAKERPSEIKEPSDYIKKK